MLVAGPAEEPPVRRSSGQRGFAVVTPVHNAALNSRKSALDFEVSYFSRKEVLL